MTSFQRDIGAYITPKNALNPVTVTAGTTADANEYEGHIIDRRSDLDDLLLSAKVVLNYDASLGTTGASLTLASNIQHSDTTASSAFSDYDDKDGSTGASVTETRTTAGNASPSGVLAYDVDLSSAKRYVRVQATPTLSATATDTADIGGVIVFGGSDQPPAS